MLRRSIRLVLHFPHFHGQVITMTWETPQFVEVKMDAEINSYQDDFGEDRDTGV